MQHTQKKPNVINGAYLDAIKILKKKQDENLFFSLMIRFSTSHVGSTMGLHNIV